LPRQMAFHESRPSLNVTWRIGALRIGEKSLPRLQYESG
jgi:hypothetical protein